jgi:protein-S-isoprenylcysteine O-methyltransferase Ste14
MSVFLLQMLVMLFVNPRILGKSHVPKKARRNWLEQNIPVIANAVWLLAMIYSIFLPLQSGTIWFYIGLSFFIIGVIILAIATYNFIATPVDQLIATGAYHFSRHPMYLATFFICMGAGISAISWLFIGITLIMIICFHQEALIEERICLDTYGNTYQQYRDRVPRWFGIPN